MWRQLRPSPRSLSIRTRKKSHLHFLGLSLLSEKQVRSSCPRQTLSRTFYQAVIQSNYQPHILSRRSPSDVGYRLSSHPFSLSLSRDRRYFSSPHLNLSSSKCERSVRSGCGRSSFKGKRYFFAPTYRVYSVSKRRGQRRYYAVSGRRTFSPVAGRKYYLAAKGKHGQYLRAYQSGPSGQYCSIK